jgi:hypothetical protein
MIKSLALALVLISPSESRAAPAALLCTGTSDFWSSTRGPEWSESQEVLPIKIDIARNKLALDNQEYPITAISGHTVFVDDYLYGIDVNIDLNRVTGKVFTRFATRLDKGRVGTIWKIRTFNGICRPTQKIVIIELLTTADFILVPAPVAAQGLSPDKCGASTQPPASIARIGGGSGLRTRHSRLPTNTNSQRL